MKHTVTLSLVVALALILVPYSSANELLPPDIIRMLEAPAVQTNVLAPKDSPKVMSADNPTDVKKSEEVETRPVLQLQTLNELLPPDIIRMLEAPAVQTNVLAPKDSPRGHARR